MDSSFVYFYKVEPCDLLISSRFRGVFDHAPQDSTEIEFLFMDLQGTSPCADSFLFGINLFNKGDTIRIGWDGIANTKVQWISTSSLDGEAIVDPTSNSIAASYRWDMGQSWNFSGKLIK